MASAILRDRVGAQPRRRLAGLENRAVELSPGHRRSGLGNSSGDTHNDNYSRRNKGNGYTLKVGLRSAENV